MKRGWGLKVAGAGRALPFQWGIREGYHEMATF